MKYPPYICKTKRTKQNIIAMSNINNNEYYYEYEGFLVVDERLCFC